MKKLPKNLIKKYGISKKAWQVFKNSKSKKNKNKRGLTTMARKRKSSRSSKGNGLFSKSLQILTGAAVAALYEVFISPMIPLSRNIKNIVEMVLGVLLASSKKMPMAVRAGGAALATINAFELILPLVSNIGVSKK